MQSTLFSSSFMDNLPDMYGPYSFQGAMPPLAVSMCCELIYVHWTYLQVSIAKPLISVSETFILWDGYNKQKE